MLSSPFLQNYSHCQRTIVNIHQLVTMRFSILALLVATPSCASFGFQSPKERVRKLSTRNAISHPTTTTTTTTTTTSLNQSSNPLEAITNLFDSSKKGAGSPKSRICVAQNLLLDLIEEQECYTTESGAQAFGNACAPNVVYEDCYEPQPIVGKTAVIDHMLAKVAQRKGRGGFRVDKISDGTQACGFAWTWTSGDQEGLRGTTFVELNEDSGEIQYVREIPEPLYKPGDLTLELLKAVTADAEPNAPVEYQQQTPTTAHEVAKYLFNDVQGSSIDESMRFFDDNIIYRDFNYEDVLEGPEEVRKFIEDFSFPGITFRPQKFDDGLEATCFTWEVVLDGAPDTIKGMSFYELDPVTKKAVYVRDVPESAIKPPVLGKLARQLRPGLGTFQGVPLGSRPGGK